MILALLLLLAGSVQAQNLTVAGPFTGLNDTNASITLDPSEAQSVLNVEVSEDGLSLKKRKGFTLTNTLSITTSPVTGSIYFRDPSGNNIRLFASDNSVYKSVNGGAFTAILSTMPVNTKWDFCESGGKVYAFNTNHDTPWSWDGTTFTYYPSMPKGSICAVTATRMLVAGTTDYPNRLYFSAAGDFTNFTLGTGVNDPSFDDVGLAGEKITALYATEAEWLVFKSNSFSSYQGTNQYDLVASVVSNRVGMSEPQAIVSHEGIVYFKGTDNKIWAYNSGTVVDASKKIETFTGLISNSSATVTKAYVSENDYNQGTFYNTTSSATYGSITPLSYTYTDTLSADFAAGTVDVALTTANDEIKLSAVGGDTGDAVYFENIGVELGDTTNWNPLLAVANSGAYVTVYGTYFADETATGAGATYLQILKASDDSTALSYSVGPSAAVDGQKSDLSIDMSDLPDELYYFRLVCNSDTYSGSARFNKGTLTASIWNRTSGASSLCQWDIDEVEPVSSSGTFISQARAISAPQPHYGYLVESSTVTTGSEINYYISFATASTGVYSAWQSTSTVWCSTCTHYKWRADLIATTNTVTSPIVYSGGLSFQSTGYWLSDEVSIGGMQSWGQFLANATTTGTGAWTYTIAVSTYSGGTTGATYESLTSGSVITASTGTYVRVKAQNSLSCATETVRTDAISYSWNFATDQHAHAFEYEGDIYFAVPYNYSTTNNRLMKLDAESNGWTIFDIPINRPLVVEDYVYFGSPTGGYIYKYPFGENDNGSAINSYWKTKDFIGNNPYVEKQFTRASVIAGANSGSTLGVTYTLDTSSSTTYNVSLSTSASFVYNNRALPFGDIGQTINIQVGNNAADQPWSFYGISVDYMDKPWRVQPEE